AAATARPRICAAVPRCRRARADRRSRLRLSRPLAAPHHLLERSREATARGRPAHRVGCRRARPGRPGDYPAEAALVSSARESSMARVIDHTSSIVSRHATTPKHIVPMYDMTVMLTAPPSKIGPIGYIASIRAPAEYSGNGGPGTLETVTLNRGRWRSASFIREQSRAARAARAGGMNSAQLGSLSAPMTLYC